jgi:hypothetical protein
VQSKLGCWIFKCPISRRFRPGPQRAPNHSRPSLLPMRLPCQEVLSSFLNFVDFCPLLYVSHLRLSNFTFAEMLLRHHLHSLLPAMTPVSIALVPAAEAGRIALKVNIMKGNRQG